MLIRDISPIHWPLLKVRWLCFGQCSTPSMMNSAEEDRSSGLKMVMFAAMFSSWTIMTRSAMKSGDRSEMWRISCSVFSRASHISLQIWRTSGTGSSPLTSPKWRLSTPIFLLSSAQQRTLICVSWLTFCCRMYLRALSHIREDCMLSWVQPRRTSLTQARHTALIRAMRCKDIMTCSTRSSGRSASARPQLEDVLVSVVM
mmetsp:Transcript_2222/g.6550  ORF Transcript_2222/g.6550 Transcript_2222/m.6550 type:complete len:201 (-) Transcript_2222:182-784(-)